jgi:cytochrome d ubiquinol oxidase subunit I
MTPAGFIAVLSGWITAEVGRQPFVVYGLLRTVDAASPLPGGSVAASLGAFFLVYGIVFGAGTYYLIKLVKEGPGAPAAQQDTIYKQPMRPLSLPDENIEPTE